MPTQADAAYDRAVAAYQDGAFDVSRRWVLEALAQDSAHARARALLARLDAVRRPPTAPPPAPSRPRSQGYSSSPGPEVVSTDPTVLITRASASSAPQQIEPTVLITRDSGSRRRPDDDPFAASASARVGTGPVSEPTMIVERSRAASSASTSSSSATASRTTQQKAGGGLSAWFAGWRSQPGAAARTAGGNRGGFGGAGLAIGVVAAGAVILFLGIAAVRWLWPSGQVLTLTKPVGGTITGPGLKCGTRGSDCTTSRPNGDPVELVAEADQDYVFSGFTGDCAPAGRLLMNGSKTCGATFDKVSAPTNAVTFPLSITKPTGGTLIGPGSILCGTLGNACTANVPSGLAVTLHFEADTGFVFGSFTGECSATGETTMTGPRTCGATFVQTATPVANVVPPRERPQPQPLPRPRTGRDAADANPPARGAAPPVADAPPPLPQPAPATTQAPPPTVTGKVEAPISEEEHAKKEILQLVDNFCAAYETLKAERIRDLYPLAPMEDYRSQFKEYKSLRCTITSPPKFDRLDAGAAGGAQVKFGMKREIQMRSNGAPAVYETIVTMVLSRPNFQSKWLIDRVRHDPKPKD